MPRPRTWTGALLIALTALLLASCAGGTGEEGQVASQTTAAQESTATDQEARVQWSVLGAHLATPTRRS